MFKCYTHLGYVESSKRVSKLQIYCALCTSRTKVKRIVDFADTNYLFFDVYLIVDFVTFVFTLAYL